jgi:predicted phage tail protein
MIRNIHMHGRLKKQFGAKHRFAVETAGEAMRALNCAFPGAFVEALRTGSFKIVRGDRYNGMHIADLDLINSFKLGAADLHIIPVAAGAANGKGVAKTILGVALIGGAIFMSGGTLAAPLTVGSLTVPGMSWGTVAALGLGIALQGASTLLAKPTSADAAKNDGSFNLPGSSNTGNQGDAIQLIYGRTMVDSVNVSFDNSIEDIGAYSGVDATPPTKLIGGAYS